MDSHEAHVGGFLGTVSNCPATFERFTVALVAGWQFAIG
jgi:hypothetical protein